MMSLSRGPFVVMGVSGCGKSSVASLLASQTGGVFLDADDFHPPENKAKMSAGVPLTDEDRVPWLDALNREMRVRTAGGNTVFLACSALRQTYRERLAAALPKLKFIYLRGSPEVIRRRLQQRRNHFMPAGLLESQFATLEEPAGAIVVLIEDPLPVIVHQVLEHLSDRETAGG